MKPNFDGRCPVCWTLVSMRLTSVPDESSPAAVWSGRCGKGHVVNLTASKPGVSGVKLFPKESGSSPSIRNSKLAKGRGPTSAARKGAE